MHGLRGDKAEEYHYWKSAPLARVTADPAGTVNAKTYTYDAEGNLISVAQGGTVVGTYSYDALNRRTRTATSSGTSEFVFDLAGRRVSAWSAGAAAPARVTIYGDGGTAVAYRVPGSGTYFEHTNWVGTLRAVTGPAGAVAETVQSLPFGDGRVVSGAGSGSGADPADYATLDYDAESNSEHAQYRQLSQSQGRWLSPDPYYGSYDASNPQSFDRYVYVRDNPVNYLDSSGLDYSCVTTETYYVVWVYDPDGDYFYPEYVTNDTTTCTNTNPGGSQPSCGLTGNPCPTGNGGGSGGGGGGGSAPSNPTPQKPTPPQGNSWSHPLTPPTCQQWKNWGKADAYIAGGSALIAKTFPKTAPVTVPVATVFGFAALLENGVAWAEGCYF